MLISSFIEAVANYNILLSYVNIFFYVIHKNISYNISPRIFSVVSTGIERKVIGLKLDVLFWIQLGKVRDIELQIILVRVLYLLTIMHWLQSIEIFYFSRINPGDEFLRISTVAFLLFLALAGPIL